MNRPPNQPTLRDLLRPVAAHRLLLVAVILIAVGASVAYSSSQKPVYTARASLSFQDQSRDLGLVGLAITPTQSADQLASAGAQTITAPRVARQVKRDLHSSLPVTALSHSITATVQPTSNLVVVQADASSPSDAQKLANSFATQDAALTNDRVRSSYAAALKQLTRFAPKHKQSPTASDLVAQELYQQQLIRLQALSTIANAAQVVSLATLPSSPTSPRPLRNALLAAVLGLILGLLAVYARDSFDRRLRSASEIEEQFALPLLGHVRTDALGRSPTLNGDRGAGAADWELFRIVRRNLDFLEQGATSRTVVVTSSLPEEGKTTVASFLAFASAAAGKRTLLIECDLRRPVLAGRLGLDSAPGVSDFVTDDVELSAILQTVRFGDPISVDRAATNGTANHDVEASPAAGGTDNFMHEMACAVAGTRTQHPVEILRSARFGALLEQVRSDYDLVILDTPPLLSVVDALELLPRVETAVLCVRVSSTTRQQARAGRAALERLPQRPTGLVVTGTRRGDDVEYGYHGYYV